MENIEITRRRFLASAGSGLIATGLAGGITASAAAQTSSPPPDVDTQKPIPLPPTSAGTERTPGQAPLPMSPDKRIGFAVVGLGNLALVEIIPAFSECKKAKLTALVSGDAAKAAEVAAQHGVPAKNIYSYQTYDQLRNNPDVDVIYIVLPNALHAEYTVRGAQAGKHILCEKPMATSASECKQMIDACRKADKKLMIAYRIQYEPYNRHVYQMVRDQTYGPVKYIEGVNGQTQGDPNQWRQKKALSGGGSLPDVGLYCLNTFRYLTGEEPVEVFAQTYSTPNDPRFKEVEENCVWQMRFPSGLLANCASGYGFHQSRRYRVYASTGWFGLDPAFDYTGLQMQTSHAEGKIEYRQTPMLESKNQFALEMDHMADCVIQNKGPYTPGEEGLQDQRIMTAIYESAAGNKPVMLPLIQKRDAFRGSQPAED